MKTDLPESYGNSGLWTSVYFSFIFGCAGSSLLHWLFYSCGQLGLLSSCNALSLLLLLLWNMGSRGCWLLQLLHVGSEVATFRLWSRARELWSTDLVASRHVGSSYTRDLAHASCTGRQILHHWATRKAPRFWTCIFYNTIFIMCLHNSLTRKE